METCRNLIETLEEIEVLWNRVKMNDLNAINEVAENNLRLINYCIDRQLSEKYKSFIGLRYEYEDLFQVGSIGLTKAIKRYNRDYGVNFSTYAVPLIVGEINMYIRDDLKFRRKNVEEHEESHSFVSISQPAYTSKSVEQTYEEVIEDNINIELLVIEHHALKAAINVLNQKEKAIIIHYYINELSQSKIAKIMELGQVQVSRILRKSIIKMRTYYEGGIY